MPGGFSPLSLSIVQFVTMKVLLTSDPLGGYCLYFFQQNRPLNSQNAADSLQKFTLKKAAIQKALDSLADSGKISFKEYGKQKIYLARQDQFNIPNNEELSQMKEDNAKLQEQLNEQKKAISEVEGGIHTHIHIYTPLCFKMRCDSLSSVP